MSDPKFVIHGKTYPFPDNLTLGEEAEVERITGQGYRMDQPGALGVLALAYIAAKRIDSTVQLADIEMLAGDDLKFEKGDEPDEATIPLPDAATPNEPAATSSDGGTPGSDDEDSTQPDTGTSTLDISPT